MMERSITRYCDARMEQRPFERGRLHAVERKEFGVDLPPGPFVSDTYAVTV